MSFFQSVLLRCWQPFSVMPLLSEYKHSYREITISGAATVPSRVVCSPYLRFCCHLIYILVTEVEQSQSVNVGSAEGDAPLLSDAVAICIKLQLHSQNEMYSAVFCFPSFFSPSLRTAARLPAETLFFSELVDGYAGNIYERLIQTPPLF